MQLEKLSNVLIMDSSDEGVLLESSCFLLNYHQEQIKRKRKRTWIGAIFKKRIEQGFYHNFLQEMRVSDRESNFGLLSQYFPSSLFSFFVSFIFFFIKARILLEFLNQEFSILYMFPHFLSFS